MTTHTRTPSLPGLPDHCGECSERERAVVAWPCEGATAGSQVAAYDEQRRYATEEWMRKHKGAYLRSVAEVWACNDDCGCTQAQVTDLFANLKDPRYVVRVCAWEGEFYTGDWHEPEDLTASDELDAYRAALLLSDPKREAAILWPAYLTIDGEATA